MHLTSREKEIVALVKKGLPNKDIGTQLGISLNTVKVHLNHIFKKKNVSSRVELILLKR